jgi:antitoxin component of RelBE/YafQ-DinJ toxin-antitoxin module
MLSPTDLLSPEESAQVDAALMTNQDKFSTRIALYSLGILRQIAQEQNLPLEAIGSSELQQFLAQDNWMEQTIAATGLTLDDSFRGFWTNLILSAHKPLTQAAQSAGITLNQIELQHLIAWFETQSKAKVHSDPQS